MSTTPWVDEVVFKHTSRSVPAPSTGVPGWTRLCSNTPVARCPHRPQESLGGRGCVQTHQTLGAPTEHSLRVSVLPGVGCSVMLFLLHGINYQRRHKTLPRSPQQLQPTADRAPPGRWDRSRLIHPRGTTHRTAQTSRRARRRREPIIKVRWLDLNLCGATVYHLYIVPSGAGGVRRGKGGWGGVGSGGWAQRHTKA